MWSGSSENLEVIACIVLEIQSSEALYETIAGRSNRLHVLHYSAQTEALMTVKLHHDVAKEPRRTMVQ